MRPRSLAFLPILLLVSGCIGGDATPPDGRTDDEGCPATPADLPRQGTPVEVHVANAMDEEACVRVFFDDALVAAGALAGERAGLHNNPTPLASLAWSARTVMVRVESEPGAAHEERLTLPQGKTGYVVAWVDVGGTTLRVYDSPPRWA
ncbi:MAG TPA: hypothetical protein VNX21_03800 [Candidatus Thermoplasmatota archaeon]|nr:hypothetical protein [Candidatus Thermoplasmatota archaeon]